MKIRSRILGVAAAALSVSAPVFAGSLLTPRTITPRPNDEIFTSAPKRPDLTVNLTAPSGVYVGAPGVYQAVVSNIGNNSAAAVRLIIALPRTHTSPTVHILGNLGAFDGRCTLSGTNLDCPLGTLNRNSSALPVTFTLALPQNSVPIVVSASVTTTTTESSTTNNADSETPSLLHLLTPISVGDTAHVEHCTGTNLTSFFECTLYPSSIASHDISFDSGGLVSFIGAPATYWGTWSQAAGNDRLVLEYYDGASHEATFDGYSVGPGRCFEGVTVFYPASVYVSPYRVCLP